MVFLLFKFSQICLVATQSVGHVHLSGIVVYKLSFYICIHVARRMLTRFNSSDAARKVISGLAMSSALHFPGMSPPHKVNIVLRTGISWNVSVPNKVKIVLLSNRFKISEPSKYRCWAYKYWFQGLESCLTARENIDFHPCWAISPQQKFPPNKHCIKQVIYDLWALQLSF